MDFIPIIFNEIITAAERQEKNIISLKARFRFKEIQAPHGGGGSGLQLRQCDSEMEGS